jgi:hypothetical protein
MGKQVPGWNELNILSALCTKAIATHVQQEDQNPKFWDGPLTLLEWHAWLPSSKKRQPGAMGLIGLCHCCFPQLITMRGWSRLSQLDIHLEALTLPLASLGGGNGLEFLGNASASGCSEGWSFEEMSNACSNCRQGRCLVLLRWTFIWDSFSQME